MQDETLEESQLEERLKEMKIEAENIAQVIAANTGKTGQEVTNAMLAIQKSDFFSRTKTKALSRSVSVRIPTS